MHYDAPDTIAFVTVEFSDCKIAQTNNSEFGMATECE